MGPWAAWSAAAGSGEPAAGSPGPGNSVSDRGSGPGALRERGARGWAGMALGAAGRPGRACGIAPCSSHSLLSLTCAGLGGCGRGAAGG